MSELKALSVTEISTYFKRIFEMEEMLYNVKVYGEITGLSVVRGNAFFCIKDENALMNCVFYGVDETFNVKNGDQVILKGTPRYYVKGGKLNFTVTTIEPYGLGDLYKRFLELKDKLSNEGLFDNEHKKTIPKSIKRIGVVSSETGAVIQDIKNVSFRRNPGVNIVLYPVKVQGTGSEKEIISGINFFNNYDVDVIIVARGGGSFEDLMPFNDEALARCIYNSNKPVISAVGHETDFTIIDFVSDLRAPTPSAAAELVVDDIYATKRQFKKVFERFIISSETYISEQLYDLQKKYEFIENCLIEIKNKKSDSLKYIKVKMLNAIQNYYNDKSYELALTQKKLEKYNPFEIFKQGYAKVEQDGKPIDSIKNVDKNLNIDIYMKDGKIVANAILLEGNK